MLQIILFRFAVKLSVFIKIEQNCVWHTLHPECERERRSEFVRLCEQKFAIWFGTLALTHIHITHTTMMTTTSSKHSYYIIYLVNYNLV